MSGRRVKVVKKVIGGPPKGGLGLPTDLGQSLNECLFDKNLAFAKYGKMIRLVEQFVDMLQSTLDAKMFPSIENPKCQFATQLNELHAFAKSSCAKLYGTQNVPCSADGTINADISHIDPAKDEHFQEIYEEMRGSPHIKTVIQVADKLHDYEKHIKNLDALDGHFLSSMPGTSFIPFADFDVKNAYIQTTNKSKREFILVYLNKLYTYGYKLYLEYTAPDMNVDQMKGIVQNALVQLRKEPRLSRCGTAFDMIESSISMLQNNFGEYYTDYLQSRSSSTIFENFILDVAKDSKSKKRSAMLAHQFNEIIKFYREAAKQSSSNPQAEALFERFAQFNSQLGVQHLGSKSKSSAESGGASSSAAEGKKPAEHQQMTMPEGFEKIAQSLLGSSMSSPQSSSASASSSSSTKEIEVVVTSDVPEETKVTASAAPDAPAPVVPEETKIVAPAPVVPEEPKVIAPDVPTLVVPEETKSQSQPVNGPVPTSGKKSRRAKKKAASHK